ncbi:MAG: N-acetyltransferase [Firmicutes bacterium]|nr:N-acetyltransferase [Bacillota bacterium]MBR3034561.1 N-acetyltransferase [Bacillota bacterium]MBR3748539.1 N-acetyltransferase [Bacillota bacterium]MBR4142777.1 N-acetyltransferase [Bacillota bacterium]MBR6970104.1 N-acetyltransferase [Bacillota bacterium]
MPQIWQAVSCCPSGALTCAYTHGITVRFEVEKCRSAAYDGEKEVGVCLYREGPDGWSIVSTRVDPAYGGKGIAKRLVYSVVEAAERSKQGVIPVCSYAVKVLA